MESILFIGLLIAFVLIFNQGGRIKKLEQSGTKPVVQSSNNAISQDHSLSKEIPGAVPDDLYNYVVAQLSQGVSQEQIKQILQKTGWTEQQIHDVFTKILASSDFKQPMAHAEPDVANRFIEWMKEEWLMKLGAGLLLIAFGWFTTYAFANWMGPMGRISIGIMAGVVFLLFGWQRIRNYVHQGGVLLVLGSTIILLTTFAARAAYDFFTPSFALFVMFLSTAFVALASVRYKSNALALGSLILAGVAPLLTAASAPSYVAWFWYLLVIVIGAIWIVVLTGNRALTAAALILVAFYSFPHFISYTGADMGALLLFAYVFVVIFFFTNTIGILKAKTKEISADLVTAMGNGLFLLAWIMVAAPDQWKSLIISAWMVVFMVGAFAIYKATRKKEPFYVYAGVGLVMLAAATAAELSGAALTIAYTIESSLVVYIAYALLKDVDMVQKLSYLLAGPIVLSFGSLFSSSWRTGVFHSDFFVLFLLCISLLSLGGFFFAQARERGEKDLMMNSMQFTVVGSLFAYVLLWLSLHAGLESYSAAVMIALVVYTIIGLTTYFTGMAESKKALRIYGGILIGFVVGRLMIIDVWSMEMSGRIIIFFLIGMLLISTAFLGRKKHEEVQENTL